MREILEFQATQLTKARSMRIKMSHKTSTTEAPTHHSGHNNTLINCVAGCSSVVHRVRVPQGHVLRLEILERFLLKCSTMCPQLCLPEVCNIVPLVGGSLSSRRGCGKLYVKQSDLMSENQFLLFWLETVRSCRAILWILFPGRLQIIPNKSSCF